MWKSNTGGMSGWVVHIGEPLFEIAGYVLYIHTDQLKSGKFVGVRKYAPTSADKEKEFNSLELIAGEIVEESNKWADGVDEGRMLRAFLNKRFAIKMQRGCTCF